jgi:hypothetical protein
MNEFPAILAVLEQDTGAIIGFLVLLAILLLILFRGTSRVDPAVIEHDPPRFPASSPYHDSNRRKAAAAAVVAHRHASKENPS